MILLYFSLYICTPRQTARVTPRYVASVLPGRMLMLYRGHSRTSLPILIIYIYIYVHISIYISIYIYMYIYIYIYIYIICYPFLMSHEMADHFDPRRFFQQCWGRGLPTKKRRGYIYIYIYRVAIFIFASDSHQPVEL